jgi:predicted dehydrogenase
MNGGEIGFGAIGCGGFGLFALRQLVQVPGLDLVAVTDVSREAAARASEQLGVDDTGGIDDLLERADVDAVYIATPSFLHHDHAMRALAADKHVICEAPLAVDVGDGKQMIAEALRRDRLMVTGFLHRYHPLSDVISRLLPSGALGQFLHGSFESMASQEHLPPGHWFWDRAKSGGIFVEYGLPFFDLFAGWFGTGRVHTAWIGTRPGSDIEERASCAVRYDGGGWADFHHGFHRASRRDRQALRLVFELGDVTLLDWIPTSLRVHALVPESQAHAVAEMFPSARLDVLEPYSTPRRGYRSGEEEWGAHRTQDMAGGEEVRTAHRHGELLRAMFADQAAWIRDHDHLRRVTEADGYDALATAHQADQLAGLAPVNT